MERTVDNAEFELNQQQPIVLFDIDNTLVDGFTIFPFVSHLAKNHLVRPDTPSIMYQDLSSYENGGLTYQEFAEAVVDHYYEGLSGFTQSDIESAGENYLEEYKKRLFPYATSLARIMNIQGKTIVVSGAPREAFLPMAKYLNIAESFLLEGEVIDGNFSGKTKVNMALKKEKEQVIFLLTNTGYLKGKSFAFGDSSSDIPILEAVSNPFVVNAKKELAEVATKNGWTIVDVNNIIQEVNQRLLDLEE